MIRFIVSGGRFSVLMVLALAVVAAGGCRASRPAAPPKVVVKKAKPVDPWFKAQAFCTLPLSKAEVPNTGGQLRDSILTAWARALAFKDPASVVTIVGGRYPAVESLRVNLSNASAKPNVKPQSVGEPRSTGKSLLVEDFALVAEPLVSQKNKSKVNLQVTGEDVRFELQRDKAGNPLLMLTDAKEGTLHFDAAVKDLEKVLLAGMKERAPRGLVTVRNVKLDLRTAGPRSLDARMHVSTLVGFVPAGLRITARVDIDRQMNARVYDLSASGDELLGPLIVRFVGPAIRKYNDKTRPLMTFPKGKLELKDVQISAGDRLTMNAVFGRVSAKESHAAVE